jgi:hypothetical protein
LIERLFTGRIHAGVAEALARLKRRAERAA